MIALRAITFIVIIVAVCPSGVRDGQTEFVQPMVRALHALADAGNIPLLGVSNKGDHWVGQRGS